MAKAKESCGRVTRMALKSQRQESALQGGRYFVTPKSSTRVESQNVSGES
jgi:hypothetical protein